MPHNSRLLWTPEEDAILGTMTDFEIATRLGRTVDAVKNRRIRLGKLVASRGWSPEEDALLDAGSDSEVASAIGRTVLAVQSRRRNLGISRSGRKRWPDWTPEEDAVVLASSDSEAIARLGRTRSAVEIRRRKLKASVTWTPEEDAILGTIPDEDAAAKLGRRLDLVVYRRCELNVPPPPPSINVPWTPEEDAILGTIPDEDAAAKLGRRVGAVEVRRQRLGIKFRLSPWGPWRPKPDGYLACVACGRPFGDRPSRRATCSDPCRRALATANRRAWHRRQAELRMAGEILAVQKQSGDDDNE